MSKRIPLAGAFALLAALAPVSQVYGQSNHGSQHTQAPTKNENLFLPNLLEMNAAESEIGRLAASRGQNQRVKDFGQMVAKVHMETVESLGGLYQVGASITPRSGYYAELNKDHQKTIDRLKGLSGPAFDREVMNVLVTMHKDSAKFLENNLNTFRNADSKPQAGTYGKSPAAGNWRTGFVQLSERLLPGVRYHLEQAQLIQRDLHGAPHTNQ